MITIVDYGAGNLRSVQNTLDELGAEYELVRDAAGVLAAKKIILPGVGHFGHLMRSVDQLQIRGALLDRLAAGVPFLGICLGLQALFETSEEAPEVQGLGVFPGIVKRFPAHARVPHMGWDAIARRACSKLVTGEPYVYFAHSYYVPEGDYTAASCFYEETFTAVLEQSNVFGVQFHPEKSGPQGLEIVRRFVAL